MRIVVVSDSHGYREPIDLLLKRYPDAVYYIHCGDSELPPVYLNNYNAVKGNNDKLEVYLSHGQIWSKGIKYAELDIVKRKFPLYTYDDKAWAYNSYDDENIIKELSKSAVFSLTVDFNGDKKLIDLYSLNGFNESIEEIKKLCQ